MAWTTEQLQAFARADDCRIAPFRQDGVTCGTPTFIWSVVVEDALFVRAYSGTRSSWYQAALQQKAGQLTLAAAVHDVNFDPVEGEINDRIDEAYKEKYAHSRYLSSMISDRARAATVKVTPKTASQQA
ncbi:hypothetical protein SAMN04488056_103380 [Cohaesibacter marisflavi]|uniref:DUF2255 family protein n=1 Tax=Cohaesibacter marisflavi TaxID=655353 RepID=A0A1I5EWK8_9HYPH|nr:DUF2255 family protein [Cohaesibacter marisflavi]SFO15766.1 hypothetical protein SAMN04488056_103380 [Cohaesibacter marisflavi]